MDVRRGDTAAAKPDAMLLADCSGLCAGKRGVLATERCADCSGLSSDSHGVLSEPAAGDSAAALSREAAAPGLCARFRLRGPAVR